jgi:hypothetical protein
MGQHIIPQFYLKGFASSDLSKIWIYEKGKSSVNLLPIKTIAQEKQFYDEKTEKFLANEIEGPANKVLEKIRQKLRISEKDKFVLSEYIFTFFKRVPRAKQRLIEVAPRLSAELIAKHDEQFDELKKKKPEKSELYKEYEEISNKTLNQLGKNPQKEIWLGALIMRSKNPPRILSEMNWIFLICDEPYLFLANDNPVFFHTSHGLNKRKSELTFPISSNIALLATWWTINLKYVEADGQLIREINRRIVANATRFVYSAKQKDWISTLIKKNEQNTHLISK